MSKITLKDEKVKNPWEPFMPGGESSMWEGLLNAERQENATLKKRMVEFQQKFINKCESLCQVEEAWKEEIAGKKKAEIESEHYRHELNIETDRRGKAEAALATCEKKVAIWKKQYDKLDKQAEEWEEKLEQAEKKVGELENLLNTDVQNEIIEKAEAESQYCKALMKLRENELSIVEAELSTLKEAVERHRDIIGMSESTADRALYAVLDSLNFNPKEEGK